MRFPGLINGSLRKMAVNLTPFPMAHFLVPSHAPLLSPESLAYSSLTSDFLTSQAYSASNMMCEVDPRHGLYLSLSAAYRGSSLKTSSIEFNLLSLQNKGSSYFVSWYAYKSSYSLCSQPSLQNSNSLTLLGNTSASN